MTRRRWKDMSGSSKTAILVLASVQLSLAVTAWIDLARRPPAEVNGSKLAWAAIIAINFVGPAAYFALGRRAAESEAGTKGPQAEGPFALGPPRSAQDRGVHDRKERHERGR
jgi:hypothetical protein